MVKGILFDKDGTLIDFFELWLGAAKWAIPRMMEEKFSFRRFGKLHS